MPPRRRSPPTVAEEPEFVMPVPAAGAAQQFFIEAMRQNTEVLKRVGRSLDNMYEDQKEDRRILTDVQMRMVALETNQHEKDLERFREEVKEDINALKQDMTRANDRIQGLVDDKHMRKGAIGVGSWFTTNFQNIVAIILFLGALVLLALKMQGRIP